MVRGDNMLSGYKVFIRYYNGHIVVRHFRCKLKYDLFAYIGWLYSTSSTKIERIDYKAISQEGVNWDMSSSALSLYYKDFPHDSKIKEYTKIESEV